MASAVHASTHINGTTTPSPAEDEELYTQLLQLQDVVIAGKHASLKLPSSAIERLKATLKIADAQARESQQSQLSAAINGTAFATNQAQAQQSSSFYPTFAGLPGLHATSAPAVNGAVQSHGAPQKSPAGLDPIFLQKSDSLVRAEGQLKRQRLDRELQTQLEQRKHSFRDRDADAPSPIDVDDVLLKALERVKPISGLQTDMAGSAASSSFDTNDYYSSQVQSDWSSEASSSKASDKAAGAFTADFERLDDAPQASASSGKRPARFKEPYAPAPSKRRPHVYTNAPEGVYEVEEEDDEYTPPDATAFDSFRDYATQDDTPPEDDNSDYEPGEITQDSNVPTPQHSFQNAVQPSPRVPVIRNHLTHIAAPQPNRVSPLATAKGPSIELELVNGRPEVVQKPQYRSNNPPSRASTASPPNHISKQRRNKKRKRGVEPTTRAKRRKEKQPAVEPIAPFRFQETYIKDEPVSPPTNAFSNIPELPSWPAPRIQPQPTEADLRLLRNIPSTHGADGTPRSGLRYEALEPANANEPIVIDEAPPVNHRRVRRDTQDLRRVASLQHARRPPSPPKPLYSPVGPYRARAVTYGDPRLAQPAPQRYEYVVPDHQEQAHQDFASSTRTERSRSPQPELQGTVAPYPGRTFTPVAMPPPAAPPRRIVVDQYGNRYYAAEPAPAPRASMAPVERPPQPEVMHERSSSRMSTSYVQQLPQNGQYQPVASRMPPPPPPVRSQTAVEQQYEYIDENGYRVRAQNLHPPEPIRYVEPPISPVYRHVPNYEHVPAPVYEQMPAPAPQQVRAPTSPTFVQAREPTSPSYVQAMEPTSPAYVQRSYSTHPQEPQQMQTGYIRHGTVAPVQYVPREAPAPVRAVSVMPGQEYGVIAPQQYQRTYTQAPQDVRYTDQYGNEVFASNVRQVPQYSYQ